MFECDVISGSLDVFWFTFQLQFNYREPTYVLKVTEFWGMTPCNLVDLYQISEDPATTICMVAKEVKNRL